MKLWVFLKKNRRYFSYINGLLFKNPLVVLGMCLAPVVVAVSSLQTAVAFVLMLVLMAVPTGAVLSLVGKKGPVLFRAILSPLLAAVWYIPALWITQTALPQVPERLGVLLPLLVMDLFFIARLANTAPRTKIGWTLIDVVCCCIGIGVPACLVGLVRELVGSGTVWGVSVGYIETVPAVALPFFGFFLVAFLGALLRFLGGHLRSYLNRYVTFHKLEEEWKQ